MTSSVCLLHNGNDRQVAITSFIVNIKINFDKTLRRVEFLGQESSIWQAGIMLIVPALQACILKRWGIAEKVRTSNEVNVISYIVFGLAVFFFKYESTRYSQSFPFALHATSFIASCFVPFARSRKPFSEHQSEPTFFPRKFHSEELRKSLFAVYLIDWLFNNAVSNARVNTWNELKLLSWMESRNNF